MHTTTKWTA